MQDLARLLLGRIARAAGIDLKIAAKLAEPAEREYFRSCVEPLLGPHAEYVGEVGGQEKWDLLGDATCLLNPLRWSEPFGMVMIESLATGTPVIATPAGSVPEIVTDGINGFVRSSEPQLAAAVRSARETRPRRCRHIVADDFSLGQMVHRHIQLFTRSPAWIGAIHRRAFGSCRLWMRVTPSWRVPFEPT